MEQLNAHSRTTLKMKDAMPTNLDGSPYIDPSDAKQLSLHDEITTEGHAIGISETAHTYKAPFLFMHGREIIGETAIREYLHDEIAQQAPTTASSLASAVRSGSKFYSTEGR